jgi:hypothetical protein
VIGIETVLTHLTQGKKGDRTGRAKRRGSGELEPLFVGSSTESCSEIERTSEILVALICLAAILQRLLPAFDINLF